jgi:hypothetical protein
LAVAFLAAIVAARGTVRASLQIPTNGLVGYWTGDNTAADSSPTGNNGSFGGSYSPNGPQGGAAFDLSTSKVVIANNAAYDFQHDPGWTVGFWFNTNNTNANSSVFLGQDNGGGYQPKWFIDYGYTVFGPNSDFVWHVNDYNTERIFVVSDSVSPIPNGWNQMTVVTDNVADTVSFYLNGQSIGTRGIPNYVLETNAPLIFGGEEGLNYNGLLADVAIYDRALSPSEIPLVVPEPGSLGLLAAAVCGMAVRRRSC